MNHRTVYPIVQGLFASLIAICFSSCNESDASTDNTPTDTPTDTSTEDRIDSAIDTTPTGTDSASDDNTDSDSDSDSDSGADTDTGTGTDTDEESDTDSETDTVHDTATKGDTDTITDGTDTSSEAPGDLIEAFTFDDGWEDFFTGGTNHEMAEWTHNPTDGTLDVVFGYSGSLDAVLVKKTVVIFSEETDWLSLGKDWSAATEIVYRIRVDEAPTGAIQPFILTGDHTEWCAEWIELVEDDNFRDYSLHIGLLNGTTGAYGEIIDISDVREVGLEIIIGPRMEDWEPGTNLPVIEPGTIRLSLDSIVVK